MVGKVVVWETAVAEVVLSDVVASVVVVVPPNGVWVVRCAVGLGAGRGARSLCGG